jgi:hypothetical protein
MSAAWANCVDAVPSGAFIGDLSRAVANDGSERGGWRWLLTLLSEWRRIRGDGECPIATYDFAVGSVERLNRAWGVIHLCRDDLQQAGVSDATGDVAAQLARFVADRLPRVFEGVVAHYPAPVTSAVSMADSCYDLVSLFMAGMRPNGSKDPLALRRAAVRFATCAILLPSTPEQNP